MVMSIEEEIQSLEQELANVKGTGSKAKKEEIQKKIDELKKSSKDDAVVDDSPEEKSKEAVKPGEEDMIVPDKRPMPTKWVKVTEEQVTIAQDEGRLVGFDPDKMIALIRD